MLLDAYCINMTDLVMINELSIKIEPIDTSFNRTNIADNNSNNSITSPWGTAESLLLLDAVKCNPRHDVDSLNVAHTSSVISTDELLNKYKSIDWNNVLNTLQDKKYRQLNQQLTTDTILTQYDALVSTAATVTPSLYTQLLSQRMNELTEQIQQSNQHKSQLEHDIQSLTLQLNPLPISTDATIKLEPIDNSMPPPTLLHPSINNNNTLHINTNTNTNTIPQSPLNRVLSASGGHQPSSPFFGRTSSLGNTVGNITYLHSNTNNNINSSTGTMMSPLALARPTPVNVRTQSLGVNQSNTSQSNVHTPQPSSRVRSGSIPSTVSHDTASNAPLSISTNQIHNDTTNVDSPLSSPSTIQSTLTDYPQLQQLSNINDNKQKLIYIMEFIMKLPESDVFNTPTSDSVAPRYSEIVKQPIDHGTILHRLSSTDSLSIHECYKQLRLVYKNAFFI